MGVTWVEKSFDEAGLIKKGDIIKCGACDKDIFKLLVDVTRKSKMESDQIETLVGNPPKNGERVKCPACGVLFCGVDFSTLKTKPFC